jgi:hypothetical protein
MHRRGADACKRRAAMHRNGAFPVYLDAADERLGAAQERSRGFPARRSAAQDERGAVQDERGAAAEFGILRLHPPQHRPHFLRQTP